MGFKLLFIDKIKSCPKNEYLMMKTVDPHDQLIISLEVWLTDLKADKR